MANSNLNASACARSILGIDTGGTFTDFVLLQNGSLRIHKVLSTPDAPERAILQGIAELGLEQAVKQGQISLVHGSTVATNAALEGKGVKTALICNIGFRDLLSIGRQTRRELYNLQPSPCAAPIPDALCFEMPGRVDRHGQQQEDITPASLEQLRQALQKSGVEAVAINLLFSFLNPEPEQVIQMAIQNALGPQCFVTASHEVLAEAGEYERGIATWLNASLGPRVQHYLRRLQEAVQPSPLAIMQSTGGTLDASAAGRAAVNMLLSGPAGGLAAARFIGEQTGLKRLLTFDMGGTSTDVALIDGDIRLTNEGSIGPWPVAVPQVDMHTIGAGGGSIAYIDAGGMLQVGPQSAGANPGPACYGLNGEQPTVTDANAILGHLQPDYFLGGAMPLDLNAAHTAVDRLAQPLKLTTEETAQGIIAIANEHMVRALRVMSIERGYHLEDFHLCCFGGAGGLHVCALAEALEMNHALVPLMGGVLSALGMVVAHPSRSYSQGIQLPLRQLQVAELTEQFRLLHQQGETAFAANDNNTPSLHYSDSVDLRYQGQRFYLNLPWQPNLQALESAFHQQHQQRFGHRLPLPLELVNVRSTITTPGAVQQLPKWSCNPVKTKRHHVRIYGETNPVPIYQRDTLAAGQPLPGPALIVENISTTLVARHWQAEVDAWGNLVLNRQ